MMRLIYGLALIAALVAVPTIAEAQQARQETRQSASGNRARAQRPDRSAAGLILQNREALNLTAEQVSQIEKIRDDLREKNRPLQRQVRELRNSISNGGQLSREQRAELREKSAPINAEMRKNTEAAREAMLQVLDAEQQEKVKEIWEKARQEQRERQRNRRQGGNPGT